MHLKRTVNDNIYMHKLCQKLRLQTRYVRINILKHILLPKITFTIKNQRTTNGWHLERIQLHEDKQNKF